ncbi:hypothetical protein IQB76_09280 [Leptospira borgpetersenii serovar Hardjo-bovis]|uniref:Uncharacterized protein n=3 Tax=Leptospira TaxID=171 RepID=Q04SN6_LEPBJ|nr:hypothetical protein [Leptospira borgpetersenii]ABJ76084.1 Hypothetical protein LBJ_1511 [Leptospira borgpetersenii serovar Hardjo-bovis str. JB197]ABJ79185.1 Hypothetical protein LBL_1735 [Leptospira borgpetersenii serovar Hardjo-bovis str. L550]AMX58492.1 hypothetical protein LBK6_09110 [Leptospira borgpetersenii serovar Hardjo]AMX61745.1 hypothetical protein LBK9_09135 [Leptospira borgpetersenii serovar Hardjo]AMX64989.1 hypothetical protein LBK30_09175 [Leptospira borgpetersenii serovar
MVFLFLSILFLILKSYSFLYPGTIILALCIVFYHGKETSKEINKVIIPLSVLTLIFFAIGGLDGSTPYDLFDLLCIHCCGILALKKKPRTRDNLQGTKFGLKTGYLTDETPSKESLIFVFLLVAGFRIWYQWDSEFWNKIDFLYLIKSGILTCTLGFLYLRSGKTDPKALFFVFLALCILFIHPSQGVLNFSYFHVFSFLQADIEPKRSTLG